MDQPSILFTERRRLRAMSASWKLNPKMVKWHCVSVSKALWFSLYICPLYPQYQYNNFPHLNIWIINFTFISLPISNFPIFVLVWCTCDSWSVSLKKSDQHKDKCVKRFLTKQLSIHLFMESRINFGRNVACSSTSLTCYCIKRLRIINIYNWHSVNNWCHLNFSNFPFYVRT